MKYFIRHMNLANSKQVKEMKKSKIEKTEVQYLPFDMS